ncbi:MAG TPA: multidrug efflux SMR transporter, partial [Symbiobacteriaceae bacterium]
MAWAYLVLGGLFEVVGVIGLKLTAHKRTWLSYVILYGGFFFSFRCLMAALEEVPLSVAYPVWTGIGTLGGALVGMVFFREPVSLLRIGCIVGIAACAAG